jgi:hypothetical protein
MAYVIVETAKVTKTIALLNERDRVKYKKVIRCLAKLAADPSYPGLASHRYDTIRNFSVSQEAIWESYVENAAPSAWRVWWYYGPEDGQITVVDLGPHP